MSADPANLSKESQRALLRTDAADFATIQAENERLRDALDVIAGFGKVPLNSEWEAGLRDIIRAMTDCAQRALQP